MARLRSAAAPAQAAEVVSSNIVGYEKLNLTANSFVMGGIQFVGVGNTAVTLADLFAGEDIPFGTEIRFLNDEGRYVYYKYVADAFDEDTEEEMAGWADGDGLVASDPVLNGDGFWISSPQNYAITQAGQVDGRSSVKLTLSADDFHMVCNPFPTGFNPNEVTWSQTPPVGTEIRVLNSKGQYQYFKYQSDAFDEETEEELAGWADGDGLYVKNDIAGVGQGFWIKVPGQSLEVTISTPIASN